MGFFSSGLQTLTGGSSSSSSGSSQSGFGLLPTEIQEPYKNFGTAVNDIIKGGDLSKYYTPTPLSAGENNAISTLYNGTAPTASSINSDINMQMNPYDSFVIDEINRQGQGDYSAVKQQLNSAGQMGSNRGLLGANDVDLSRLQQIGTFKQGEYNTALQNALTTLPGARTADAQNALTAGTYTRGIDSATNAAPITALQQIGAALGILPTSGGSQSSQSSESSSSPGLFKSFAG